MSGYFGCKLVLCIKCLIQRLPERWQVYVMERNGQNIKLKGSYLINLKAK